MAARFGRVITAMVTPFAADGSLDLDAAAALARWLVAQGSEGLVVTGTTGEGPTLTDDEDHAVWRAVREAVTVPVIAGSGVNDTRHSIELTKRAEQCGVDGILTVCPYYNRPSQEGLFRHFSAIAESTTLPVVLYDIPFRTGRKIATDTILRLASTHANVVAVKDAAHDVAETAQLIAVAPDAFEVYSGEDSLTLPLLSVGAVGAISVASHWASPQYVALFDAWDKGDVDEARRLNQALLPSCVFQSGDLNPNPVPSKAMLRTLGLPVGECRLPMGPTPPGLEERARTVYAELQAAAPVGQG